MPTTTIGDLKHSWDRAVRPTVEYIDLYDKIKALNPAYITNPWQYKDRCNIVEYCKTDDRIYLIYAETYLFWTKDGFQTLNEVAEINYNGGLVGFEGQLLHNIVESMSGTIVILGQDSRAGTNSVAWRKARGDSTFTRNVVWAGGGMTTLAGNATAGYFGTGPLEAIVTCCYNSNDPKSMFISTNDGVNFTKVTPVLAPYTHIHEVYLPKCTTTSVGNSLRRIWWVAGDDPGGAGGIYCATGLSGNTLVGERQVFAERNGYRIVSVNGNGRYVYFGNENTSGGILKLGDDIDSINDAEASFEYTFGKNRLDFHQFRSLVVSPDGLVAAISSSYSNLSSRHSPQGGYMYISLDEGRTFTELSMWNRWTPSLTYDGYDLWFTGSSYREIDYDYSQLRMAIGRVSRPTSVPRNPFVFKPIISNSTGGVTPYGLGTQERTMKTDMSAYSSIAISVITTNGCTLVLEASPTDIGNDIGDEVEFTNWWYDVQTITTVANVRQTVVLSGAALFNRLYRIRNTGGTAFISMLAFIGKN